MPQPLKLDYTAAAAAGRGLEAVIRRMLRFAVGKISLVRLHELINQLYLEELEDALAEKTPDQPPTLSMLALNSGLDTRQIHRIRNSPTWRRSLVEETAFLRELTPAASFLHLWSSDRRFLDLATGLPKTLPYTRKGRGADLLVKQLGLPRGTTLISIIAQLEDSGMVAVDREAATISLLTERFLPAPDMDQLGAMEVGFAAICRLIDTVLHNIDPDRSRDERIYQRVYWINRLSPGRLPALRASIQALLDHAEQQGYKTLSEFDPGHDLPDQVSAGFGLYFFQDPEKPD